MAFPRKFQKLIETRLGDVEHPDYVLLTYAVCACDSDSCGWGGWILEGAFKDDSSRKRDGRVLSGDYSQKCPQCGKNTFRTDATLELHPASDQSRVEIGTDNVAKVTFED